MTEPLPYLDNHCCGAPGAKNDTYHALCPVEITSPYGVVRRCTCVRHEED